MICRPCRAAGDITTFMNTPGLPNLDAARIIGVDRLKGHVQRTISRLHAQCPGGTQCCCQHRPAKT